MKSLMFIFFVGYAVKCDDSSYYVVQIPEEPKQAKQFDVYWNVPTIQCKSKRIPFTNLFENYGIIQNNNDSFRGESISILYDPGVFPALFKNQTSGVFKFRNGGVPQQGDLARHLTGFMEVMEQSIPDPKFSGIGVIDFESWRPIFRQNFAALQPYKDISYQVERKQHWFWTDKAIQAKARQRFEEAGRQFMSSTLSLARRLRPRARWGYYAYPYCFNMGPMHMAETCAKEVFKENDELRWLWEGSSALFPSTYVSRSHSRGQMVSLVRGRVAEAARLAATLRDPPPILPYFWYKYRDGNGFLPKEDIEAILDALYKSNASGFIIWGSSKDVNTIDKCQELLKYTEEILGPSVAKYTKNAIKNKNTTDDAEFTTWRPKLKDHLIENVTTTTESFISTEEKLTHENITKEIVQFVETEIKNNSSIDDEKSQFISIRKNSLITLLYNLLVYGREAEKVFSTLANITNMNQENDRNSSLDSNTGVDNIIENSSESNVMAVYSITTSNSLDFSQIDQRTEVPLITPNSDNNMDPTDSATISTTIVPNTTIPPVFTTRLYPTIVSNNINISLDDTADKVNSLLEIKNDTANILTNFHKILETLDTIDSSSTLELSTDSSTAGDNITQNLLETSITYDDVYDSLDNDTSQVDNNFTTNPTHIYSFLNSLKKSDESIESNDKITESKNEKKGFHLDKLFSDINDDELSDTTSTTEKINDATTEGIVSDSLEATTTIIDIISKGGRIKPLSEISLNNDSKDNVAVKENSLEEVTEETVPSMTTDRTETTENGIMEYEKDFGEETFGVATTNGGRQVVVLY